MGITAAFAPGTPTVARKKNTGDLSNTGKQLSLRIPADMNRRLEYVADLLSLDVSSVIRMIVAENLVAYERRAQQVEQNRSGPE